MVTIYDIAKHANVSAMTVSRVINKSGKISDKTRKKVEDAIKELNYIPNTAAKSLISKKSKILSLLITDITNPFYTKIARGAEDKAMQMGYRLILCNSDENEEKESTYIDMLISSGTDGVLVTASSDQSKKNIRKLIKHNIPVVLIDRTIKEIYCDQVISDNEHTTKKLIEHLIQQGHERIAIINGPLDVSTSIERFDSYTATLKQHGLSINEELILETDLKHGDTDNSVEKLLSLPENKRPTAIFTTNNFIAYH
ncbi:LacI family DNA-binding transcriptional regulator [Cytobacillus oceanisediminis]|nr:LacI family DNA-binding transcriptional regulator [Cytobacillus oceanisediminis]MBZ9537029.1 LacI family DNA-binding transcriptional regulator [Cytobacillus oceanisediminis]